MTRHPDPSPSDLGPNGGPDQSPPPTRWPLWCAALLVAVLVAVALFAR